MNTQTIMDLDETTVPVSSTLAVTDVQLAQSKYNDFVNIHLPVLSLTDFIRAQNLPLNEQCASVFFNRIDHLQDDDFIEIDTKLILLLRKQLLSPQELLFLVQIRT